jgi:chemotaxis protein CheZ
MNTNSELNARLEQARALVAHLEAGEVEQADKLTRQMSGPHDFELFSELGRLTRELHEAINGFLLDDGLTALVEHEIPDAAERLRYVITMTEQSANTTLTAVEDSMPLIESMQKQAEALAGDWRRFRDRELTVEEFRLLSGKLGDFLDSIGDDGEQLQARLSEVLMAQGFQDLTGQIIRKVITLVKDVEDKLVQIIRLSGEKNERQTTQASPVEASGPPVPGVDKADVVQGQDEVDDLLSSLGF